MCLHISRHNDIPFQGECARLVYTILMKILIAPLIVTEKADASYYLTCSMADLFVQEGHAVAVSASEGNQFHGVSLYPCGLLKKPMFTSHAKVRSYEEWMYARGAISRDYIIDDIEALLEAIDQFTPDLIITMDRVAAVAAARLRNVRCWAVVNNAMYKNMSFPSSIMQGLNQALSYFRLEQEFTLRSVYARCERRISFGITLTQPFTKEQDVTRIGIASIMPAKVPRTNRLLISLNDVKLTSRTLYRAIDDSFLGAPYAVYAWYKGCKPQKEKNIQYMSSPKLDLLPGSIAVIHDGNDYIFHQALAMGIPQMIITGHEYLRSYNAQTAQRQEFGVLLYEENLSMSSLYETYRKLMSNDRYYDTTQWLMEKYRKEGDLNKLLEYL